MGSSTPQPQSAAFTIDSESLRRQKEEMGEALNRARASSRGTQVNGSTPVLSSAAISVRRSASVATERTDVKASNANGTSATTPQLATASTANLPANDVAQLPTPVQELGTPAPAAPLTNGFRSHESLTPQGTSKQSVIPFERQYRDLGKGIESALLGSVIFMTTLIIPTIRNGNLYDRPQQHVLKHLASFPYLSDIEMFASSHFQRQSSNHVGGLAC